METLKLIKCSCIIGVACYHMLWRLDHYCRCIIESGHAMEAHYCGCIIENGRAMEAQYCRCIIESGRAMEAHYCGYI